MITTHAGSQGSSPPSALSRSRLSRRSPARYAAAGVATALLGSLVAGCTIVEPEVPTSSTPPPAATEAESPPAPAEAPSGVAGATEGPCHELNEGRVQFETEDAFRVLFAVAPERKGTEVKITSCLQGDLGYIEEWTAPGYVGSGGFGPPDATEVNSLQTPTGSYTMTEGFGRSDPGTELDYHELTPESRWGGRRDSPYFNRYFEGPGEWPDENLWRIMRSGLYEQAVAINFNRPPDAVAQPGLSFAIFLHAGLTESWGCVSTDLDTVTRVLQNATPGDRIIMGAEEDVFAAPGEVSEGSRLARHWS